METDNSDTNYEAHSRKSKDNIGVKRSSKKGSQSSDTELKTIQMDSSLLMPERVESGQVEFDVRHRAKLSGATNIQQSSISSDPNATTNFGAHQVLTQLSENEKNVLGSQPDKSTSKDKDTSTNQSAVQAMKKLAYKIPKVITKAIAKATWKDKATAKTSGNEKSKVEVGEDGFKIPHGTAHQNQKRLEADEC